MQKIKILLLTGITLLLILSCIVLLVPRQLPRAEYSLIIAKNSNMAQVAKQLKTDSIIDNKRVFLLLLHLLGRDHHISAGIYILKSPLSTWSLVKQITSGKPSQIAVTFTAGSTLVQIRQYVNALPNIQHLSVHMTDLQLKDALHIDLPSQEGVFAPDTYFIVPNQTDLELYQQAYQLMQKQLMSVYIKRSANVNYHNPYQLLILASLIEKETAHNADMPLIAAVFNNRLRINMPLQNDPAVFYGLARQKVVKRVDFQINTVYNTYLHKGLPPTPICLPSLNALNAAANPANNSQIFYFFATSAGKTVFSRTYSEHRQAIYKNYNL